MKWVLCCVLLLGTGLGASAQQRKIVIFDPALILNEPARQALVKAVGGTILKPLPLINGAAVLLPARGRRPGTGILRIDDDLVVEAFAKPDKRPGGGGKTPPPQPPQSLPWGVDRIDAEFAHPFSTGSGVNMAIMDTGIDLDHPDLSVAGGFNAINPRKTPNDDNGHGTHVAGTAAAQDNSIGVAGVAPGVSLYAVKVLNRQGSGFLSDVIEGLQWCIDHQMQVVNMSFGSSSGNQSFHDAIIAARNAGLIQVAAAGNSGGAVGFPAAYDETIAVAATDRSDQLASFSSRGPEIDLAAPGVSILSTFKGGGYTELSGTSMAAPHVTGTVALALAAGGVVETGAGLQSADDLKAEDILLALSEQGEGLVDAEDSVNGDAPLAGDNLAAAAKPAVSLTSWGQIKNLSR